MIIGKGIIVKNTGYPLSWGYFATLRTTQSYTITIPSWYRLHTIGAGGSGGNGGNARTIPTPVGLAVSSGGASGSTGAYAIHDIYLEHGQVLTVTLANGKTTLTVKSATITAVNGIIGTRGQDISNGSTSDVAADPVSAQWPTDVVAVGGNVLNLGGIRGNGSRYSGDNPTEYLYGGFTSVISDSRAIYTPKSATEGDAPSGDMLLGGSGAGGDGIATWNTEWQSGETGFKGGIGGVVLERGGYG